MGSSSAPAPTILLPGSVVLVRYLGEVEEDKLPALVDDGVRHRYGTSRPLFYVDAEEVPPILAWRRNGNREFVTDLREVH